LAQHAGFSRAKASARTADAREFVPRLAIDGHYLHVGSIGDEGVALRAVFFSSTGSFCGTGAVAALAAFD
jgi:hypothetical protein